MYETPAYSELKQTLRVVIFNKSAESIHTKEHPVRNSQNNLAFYELELQMTTNKKHGRSKNHTGHTYGLNGRYRTVIRYKGAIDWSINMMRDDLSAYAANKDDVSPKK